MNGILIQLLDQIHHQIRGNLLWTSRGTEVRGMKYDTSRLADASCRLADYATTEQGLRSVMKDTTEQPKWSVAHENKPSI